jgi:hypothetical protein
MKKQISEPDSNLWATLKEPREIHLYYPNRFEYFLGKIIQGMVTGRAERDLRSVIRNSVNLAEELEIVIDQREESVGGS